MSTKIENMAWSNSTLKQVRSCEQAFKYHYVDKMEPSVGSYAMERGSWFHHCIAAYHIAKGLREDTLLEVPTEFDLRIPGMEPVKIDSRPSGHYLMMDFESQGHRVEYPLSAEGMLQLLTEQVWETLPDEMREDHDLPEEIDGLLKRYFGHWHDDDYAVLLVEHRWHRKSDKGVWFTGAIDLVKRTDRGLVVATDHKTHASLPDSMYRLTDSQLHHYAWGIEEFLADHGLSLDAVEFDYIVTSPPVTVDWTQPKPAPKRATKTNPDALPKPARLYAAVKKSTNLDVFTLDQAVAAKKAELEADTDLEDWERLVDWEEVDELREKIIERESNGGSPFFIRSLMPRNGAVIEELLTEHHITVSRGRMILKGAQARRAVDFFKCRQCPFKDICVGDLYGNDITPHLDGFTVAQLPQVPEEVLS